MLWDRRVAGKEKAMGIGEQVLPRDKLYGSGITCELAVT
jgi:hypothetical protein